jgi:uncharacterized protein YjbJ (UPF0337 family)
MTMGDRIKHGAEKTKGKAKEATGKATNDKSMEAEGKGDQAAANVKQAGDKAGDAAKDVLGS